MTLIGQHDFTYEHIKNLNDKEALRYIFESLMSTYSVSGEEEVIANNVEAYLSKIPWLEVHRLHNTIVASTNLQKEHRVILAGHLDTVPVIDNFPPQWLEAGDNRILEQISHSYPDDEVMWGRGATDMKASDAVLLYLASQSNDFRFDTTYIFYENEEVAAQFNGLKLVVDEHPEWIQGDFAIIGEPTDSGIEGGCNGTIRFDVIAHGVAAHSARAWMGENAIHKVAPILQKLSEYEPADVVVDGLTYREGVNATLISGGTGTNVIPNECRVHVNYRFAPDKTIEQAKLLMMGEHCGAQLDNGAHLATGGMFAGFDIEMKDESPAARPGMNSQMAQSLEKLVFDLTGNKAKAKLGWTDVARFSQLGIPAVNLGAGSALLAHKADEQVAMTDVYRMFDIVTRWLS